jgi:hypothetical protein
LHPWLAQTRDEHYISPYKKYPHHRIINYGIRQQDTREFNPWNISSIGTRLDRGVFSADLRPIPRVTIISGTLKITLFTDIRVVPQAKGPGRLTDAA